ncbi:tumor necrosis factor ligand superfamily member 13 isoform X3 [Eubalaena glacialis]|uniref:tumor necrosis factor ligand superfamily member 13 isoform X3 n=1 Tax=Eubalaena glacialis TaxID=27606 RepID=UPI002A5A164F|nr:tumor necrosis factor ligand superfamily member 13 isoform X3 [Eubalaena glacialis]
MAARRSQRRRGRRGEPGTALLAPLVLGLGLALACLGLLLAVVSLGSRASLSAQQEPSQGDLVAEEDPDPLDLNPQTEERQDTLPFLKLVRPRRSAPKGRKPRARRAIAAHYEVHPRLGQDGAQAELQTLRREVTRLQRTRGPSEKGEGYLWLSLREQSSDGVEARENGERSRRRRAVLTKKQKKKRSVLHLVPVNITSKEDSDVTEVMWQPALWRGRGLEAQGYVIRVWDAGVYLLYSQVLFHDVTFTMGQVVSREGQGRQETLFRCIRSMPSNPDWAYNSCYSAGVFHLHQGDTLSVIIPRARAKLSLSPHGTFLGLVKL